MNMTDLATFNKAVAMAQAGNKIEAYTRLKDLQQHHPKDTNLLLWIAFTAPTLTEAQKDVAIASSLDPRNPSVVQARTWLAQEMARRTLVT